MSDKNIAQEVADLLEPTIEKAAKGATDLRMKEIPGMFQKEMERLPGIVDACIDGKCDSIADKVLEKLPKAEIPTLAIEDITKAVQAAMEGGEPFTVKGHTAHDILDCPTCKPILVKQLWEDEEYRQKVMENICQDDACRESMSKMFEEKGLGVEEKGGEDESWAERRLRER